VPKIPLTFGWCY